MLRYNNEQWDLLDDFGEIAPIVGFDFYHYQNNFWMHMYGNLILGHHKYLKGDVDFSYLNRNNWGKGGLREDAQLEQWQDMHCLLYTSPSPRDRTRSRMPSSA